MKKLAIMGKIFSTYVLDKSAMKISRYEENFTESYCMLEINNYYIGSGPPK